MHAIAVFERNGVTSTWRIVGQVHSSGAERGGTEGIEFVWEKVGAFF